MLNEYDKLRGRKKEPDLQIIEHVKRQKKIYENKQHILVNNISSDERKRAINEELQMPH